MLVDIVVGIEVRTGVDTGFQLLHTGLTSERSGLELHNGMEGRLSKNIHGTTGLGVQGCKKGF